MTRSLNILLVACALGTAAAAVPSPVWAGPKAKKPAPQTEGIITWKVTPESVVIFVDGKKIGTADKAKPTRLKAGQHLIKLVWGKDEAEEPFTVVANQEIQFEYAFEDSGKPAPAPAPEP